MPDAEDVWPPALGVRLTTVEHPPAERPFATPWTDGTAADGGQRALRSWWDAVRWPDAGLLLRP